MRWTARIRLIFLLFAALAATAAGFDPGPRIEVVPPVPDSGTLLRIAIAGRWPDGCTPALSSGEIRGHDIVLRATMPAASCAGAPHDYRIDTRDLPPVGLKLRDNGFYRVRFEVQRAPGAPYELIGFRLLYAGNDGATPPRPETGFWWPELGGEFNFGGPGLGMQLEAQADTLSLGVTEYDDGGRPAWLFGAGELAGHVAEVDVIRMQGGSGPFDDYAAPESMAIAGRVQLEIASPSRVNAWFVSEAAGGRGLRVRPISMIRFRFAQQAAQAWLGAWIVIAEELVEGVPARRIEFTAVQGDDEGFVLRDAAGANELRCTLEKARRNSPPQACTLASGKDGERREIAFSQVGLNEMRGWDGDSRRILAVKLTR